MTDSTLDALRAEASLGKPEEANVRAGAIEVEQNGDVPDLPKETDELGTAPSGNKTPGITDAVETAEGKTYAAKGDAEHAVAEAGQIAKGFDTTELSESQVRLGELEKRIHESAAQIAEHEARETQLQGLIELSEKKSSAQLHAAQDALEKVKVSSEATREELEKKLKQAATKIAEFEQTETDLKTLVTQAEEETSARLKAAHDDLQKARASADSSLQEQEKKLLAAEEKVSELDKQLRASELKYHTLAEQLKSREGKTKELETEANAAKATISEHVKSATSAADKIKELEAALLAAKTEVGQLSKDLQQTDHLHKEGLKGAISASDKIKELEAAFLAAKTEVDQLSKDLQQKDHLHKEGLTELAVREAGIKESQGKVASLEADLQSANDVVQRLGKQLRDADQRADEHQRTAKSHQEHVLKSSEKLLLLESASSETEAQYNKSRQAAAGLQSELQEFKGRYEAAEKALKIATAQSEKWERDSTDTRKKLEEVTEKFKIYENKAQDQDNRVKLHVVNEGRLEGEIGDLKNLVAKLEAKLAASETVAKDLRGEALKAQENAQEKESALVSQVADLKDRIKILETQLSKSEDGVTELKKLVSHHEAQAKGVSAELEKAGQDLLQSQKSAADVERKLTEQSNELEGLVSELRLEVANLRDTVGSHEALAAHHESAAKKATDRSLELEDLLGVHKGEAQGLKQLVGIHQSEAQELKQKVSAVEASYSTSQQELSSKEEQLDALRKKAKDSEDKVSEYEATHTKLRDEASTLAEQLRQSQSEAIKHKADSESTKADVKKLQDESANERAVLQKQIETFMEENGDVHAQLTALQDKFNKLQAEREADVHELKKKSFREATLDGELQDLQTRVADIPNLKARIAELEQKLREAESKDQQQRSIVASEEQRLAAAQKDVSLLKEELAKTASEGAKELQAAILDATDKVQKAEFDAARAKQLTAELQGQLKERETTISTLESKVKDADQKSARDSLDPDEKLNSEVKPEVDKSIEDHSISAGAGKPRRRRGKGEKAEDVPAASEAAIIEKASFQKSTLHPAMLSTLIAISMSSFFLGFWLKSKIYG